MHEDQRSIANVVILRGLPLASHNVQIQALEVFFRASIVAKGI